jgi:hypothetical protein
VSQLKQAIGSQEVSTEMPDAGVVHQFPKHILQHRLTAGDKPQLQGLIKWSSLPASLATWESLESLHQKFPSALVWKQSSTWGQVVSQEEGSVNTSPPVAQDSSSAGPVAKRITKPNPRVKGPKGVSQ